MFTAKADAEIKPLATLPYSFQPLWLVQQTVAFLFRFCIFLFSHPRCLHPRRQFIHTLHCFAPPALPPGMCFRLRIRLHAVFCKTFPFLRSIPSVPACFITFCWLMLQDELRKRLVQSLKETDDDTTNRVNKETLCEVEAGLRESMKGNAASPSWLR